MTRRDREWHRIATAARLAESMAALSTCRRLAVGCVVFSDKLESVEAVGYNGPPAGLPNDSCSGEPGACGCVHAEANALVKLRSSRGDLTMACSRSPCRHCAGLIVNSRAIARVIYAREFRDATGIETLRSAGMSVSRVDDVIPRVIVVGERARREPRDTDSRDASPAERWDASLAEGAFLEGVGAAKLASIGVDLSVCRSVNLLTPSRSSDWDAKEARRVAVAGLSATSRGTLAACGRRVWAAVTGSSREVDWGTEVRLSDSLTALAIPHPSGLSRWWNDASRVSDLREVLRSRLA